MFRASKTGILVIHVLCLLAPKLHTIAFTPSGGTDAHPAHFPGYVRIGLLNPSGQQKMECSAVKIAPKVYLTAAHCIKSPIFSRGSSLRVINLGNRAVKVVSKSVAPTSVRASDPTTGWRYEQDLGIFTIDKEIPEIKIADIGLITGKVAIQKGDRVRMVGKRDIPQAVYCYADTHVAGGDAFCLSTKNSIKEGSIRPGDSGGPLYLLKNGNLYLAGLTIEFVEESRSYYDKGRKVTKSTITQKFTRLDKGCQSQADQWVLTQLHGIRNRGVTVASTVKAKDKPSLPKAGGWLSGKRNRQAVRRSGPFGRLSR